MEQRYILSSAKLRYEIQQDVTVVSVLVKLSLYARARDQVLFILNNQVLLMHCCVSVCWSRTIARKCLALGMF
jgi:hypothetical protein